MLSTSYISILLVNWLNEKYRQNYYSLIWLYFLMNLIKLLAFFWKIGISSWSDFLFLFFFNRSILVHRRLCLAVVRFYRVVRIIVAVYIVQVIPFLYVFSNIKYQLFHFNILWTVHFLNYLYIIRTIVAVQTIFTWVKLTVKRYSLVIK